MNNTQESSPEQFNRSLFTRIKAWAVSHYGFDGRSIALFRMGLAFIFVVDIINRSKNLEAFYTDEGVFPRIEFIHDPWPYLFSLNLAQGSTLFQGFLFIIALVAGLGLFGGYQTKLSHLICWVLLLSIQSRNSYITHAGDWLLNNLFFLSLFIPMGKYYSLDLALSKDSMENAETTQSSQPFFSIPCLAVGVQLAILYIYTALIKTDPAWANGNALFYSLHNELYSTSLGQMLLNFPEVTKLLTHFSYYLELFGMGLFLIPWKTGFFRTLGVFAYMGFHLGIALCMNLGIFPWVDIFAFSLLLPTAFWTFIFRCLKTPESTQGSILLQTNNDFHKTWLKVYKTFFLPPHIPIETQSSAPNLERTWGILTLSPEGDKSRVTGKMAFEKLFQYSPLLGPFYKCFTPLAMFFAKGITFVSSFQIPKLWKQGSLKTWMVQGLSAFFMVYIIQAAILDFHKETPWFNDLGKYLRLYQHWVMFTTPKDPGSGWVYITGTQHNQASVDLTQWLFYNKVSPQRYTRPSNSRDFYPEDRWRQYFVSMSVVNSQTQRKLPYIPLYLCKTWNATKPMEDPQRLFHVEMGYFFVPTPNPGENELPPVKRPYWEMNCN